MFLCRMYLGKNSRVACGKMGTSFNTKNGLQVMKYMFGCLHQEIAVLDPCVNTSWLLGAGTSKDIPSVCLKP